LCSDQNQSLKRLAAARVGCQLPSIIAKNAVALFWPNFLIYAYKERRGGAFESQLMGKLGGEGFLGVSRGFGYSYRVAKDGALFSFAKLRLRDTSCTVEQEHSLLREFGNVSSAQIMSLDARNVLITPRLYGVPFDLLDEKHNWVALKWLRDFQRKTEDRSKRTNAVDEVKELGSFVRQLEVNRSLKRETLKALSSWLSISDSIRFSPVASHGDFCAPNLIVGPGLRPFVLDWEHYRVEDTPLFDLLFYVLTNSMRGIDDSWYSQEEFLSNFSGTGRYAAIMSKVLTEFCNGLDLDVEVALSYMPCVMVRYVKRVGYGHAYEFRLMLDVLASWHEIFPKKLRFLSRNGDPHGSGKHH